MLIDSAKTRVVKTQGWTGMMVSPLEALKELYWWIKKIAKNKKQQIQETIPQATVVTDASPQGWGQHQNQILERFQQHTEHGQATRYIGQVTGKNYRPFTLEQQLSLELTKSRRLQISCFYGISLQQQSMQEG
ncbi:MAG: hypothetical protein EZS28_028040 [Streblomastix strix]|uniref:Uncharacterized protein n=1 Tax=Streblomastix strix TaxID=222440 RepID=A0A5J4V1L4_9EUKA|nr:MAG: hypothetical protein EZS28_028040 [Streblomastix strix]